MIARALASHRLIVCVGVGGVGKTTISAALALEAALRGRRAVVLTIDPARALARSLGLGSLAPGGEIVPAAALADAGLAPRGTLSAAMLDQKHAWDAFVTRHAPSPEVAAALFASAFYQRLSSSFAGSTEYMAIEEMCRLSETGEHDLVVLDTPPAARAVDFLRAPERIDRLLADGTFDRPLDLVLRSAGSTVGFVLRQLERATGTVALRDIATFFGALQALVGGMRERTRRARALLQASDAAFVLVTAPRAAILEDTRTLAWQLRERGAPLAGVVVNRVHPPPAIDDAAAAAALGALGDSDGAAWLRTRWQETVAEAATEAALVEPFLGTLPPWIARAVLPEAEHDVHSLRDLAALAQLLA